MTSNRAGIGRLLGVVIVAVLGVRVLWMTVRYLLHSPGVMRFQVESGVLVFVVAVLALALWSQQTGATIASSGKWLPDWTCAVWCVSSALVFWPALSLGYLSDDFVLASRAAAFHLGAFNPESFRPIPLALWGGIIHLGGGSTTLHAVSILLHGTNAYLTTRIVRPFVSNAVFAVFAGALVLANPIAVEAVVWNSGIFDILATTLVLVSLLLARQYASGASATLRTATVAAVACSFFCKETAIVAAPLIVMDALLRGERTGPLFFDVGVVSALMVTSIAVRLLFVPSTAVKPITKYVAQRWLFGTFGGLFVPWHIDVIDRNPWIPAIYALALVASAMLFVYRRRTSQDVRQSLFAICWIAVSTLPPITMFFVAPDLEGARYLYLSTVGFGVLLSTMASAASVSRPGWIGSVAAICTLIICGGVGIRWHLQPWREAAHERDLVLQSARSVPGLIDCQSRTLQSVPDTVRGAYVFRNGISDAIDQLATARDVTNSSHCSFEWNGREFVRLKP